jgi:hypothetical protein
MVHAHIVIWMLLASSGIPVLTIEFLTGLSEILKPSQHRLRDLSVSIYSTEKLMHLVLRLLYANLGCRLPKIKLEKVKHRPGLRFRIAEQLL